MDNREVAGILKEIAILMQVRGANQFKIRAFDRAARIIEKLEPPVDELTAEGELLSVKGIGKGIAAQIEALVNTGESPARQELVKEVPESILAVIEIPGIGPKMAALLYKKHGIDDLESLERAARGGLLRKVKGFGKKVEANVLTGIEIKKHAMENRSVGIALPLARRIIEHLKSRGRVKDITQTANLRRRTETVKSIRILASSDNVDEAISDFFMADVIREAIDRVRDTAVVSTMDGLNVAFTVAKPEQYGARLVWETGSTAHVKRLNGLLEKNGFALKENGLFKCDGSAVSTPDESAVYDAAGIAVIPPEIRETGEEVDFYLENPGYRLLRRSDIKGDLQMHSVHSDGLASIRRMAEKAMDLGYSYIAITDHSQSLHVAHGVTPDRMKAQHDEIDALNEEFDGRFYIFKAAEVDIMKDGSLDYPDEILEKLDFVLASVHQGMKMDKKRMTSRIVKAVRHPLAHCLAHPSGRLIGRRPEMEIDWELVFQAAKESGAAIEINAHPSRLDLNETRCKKARDMGIPIMINTDAHSPDQMELMEYGVSTARRGWLRKEDVLNTLPTDEIRRWLKEKSITNVRT